MSPTAMLFLGAAEVFGNTASTTVAPLLVHRDHLTLANARLQTGFVVCFQLIGPPVGALLFALGRPLPFIGQAVLVDLGAIFVAQVRALASEPPDCQAAGGAAETAGPRCDHQ